MTEIDLPSEPRQRLLELASERGASLSALSRILGRNPSYLQQFVRKGSPRKLEEEDRAVLARYFGVAETELGAPGGTASFFGGRPAPLSGSGIVGKAAGGAKSGAGRGSSSALPGAMIAIPRLPLGASAGPGVLAADETAIGHIGFDRRWFREQGLDPAMLTAIAVQGDSMQPTLADGDEILVDRTPVPPRDGIHVIRRDDTLLVKRLQFRPGGRVMILSDNTAYPPEPDVPLSAIEVIGRVVWKGGRL